MTKTKNVNPPSQTKHKAKTKLTRTARPEIKIETRVVTKVHEYYLSIILFLEPEWAIDSEAMRARGIIVLVKSN